MGKQTRALLAAALLLVTLAACSRTDHLKPSPPDTEPYAVGFLIQTFQIVDNGEVPLPGVAVTLTVSAYGPGGKLATVLADPDTGKGGMSQLILERQTPWLHKVGFGPGVVQASVVVVAYTLEVGQILQCSNEVAGDVVPGSTHRLPVIPGSRGAAVACTHIF